MDRRIIRPQNLMKQRRSLADGGTVDRHIPGEGAPGGTRPLLAAAEPALQGSAQQSGRQVERKVERDLAGAKPFASAGHHLEGWQPALADLSGILHFDLIDQGRDSKLSAHAGESLSDTFGQRLHAALGTTHPQSISL